jgi:hypothetical protein
MLCLRVTEETAMYLSLSDPKDSNPRGRSYLGTKLLDKITHAHTVETFRRLWNVT